MSIQETERLPATNGAGESVPPSALTTSEPQEDARLKRLLEQTPMLHQSALSLTNTSNPHSLLFVSAEGGATAAEAALAYAKRFQDMTGLKPLVVDLAWRTRTLSRAIGTTDSTSLSGLLTTQTNEPIGVDGGPVQVLPVADGFEPQTNAQAVGEMQSLIKTLHSQFPLVIWTTESPREEEIVWALAKLFDGVVLALRAEQTKPALAQYVCERFEENGTAVVGAVLCRRRLSIPKWLYDWT